MKKRVVSGVVTATLLSGTLLVPCYASTENTDGIKVRYNNADSTFTVNGEVTDGVREWVNIVIVPGEVQSISPDSLASNDGVVMKSVQTDKNGDIALTIDLSDANVGNQRYTYYIYPQADKIKGYFAKIDSTKLATLVSDVNGATTADALKLILESAATEMKLDLATVSDKAFIAKYLLLVKPESGYTADTLIGTYFVAEGLDTTRADFTLSGLLSDYTQYIGEEYLTDYEKLDSGIASTFAKLFAANRGNKAFEVEYSDNLFVAKCVCTESSAELQNLMLAYIKDNAIDSSVYDSITNSVYKEKVFDNLYKSRNGFTDAEDLIAKFKSESTTQKAAENAVNGGGGGSQNDGGSSNGGSDIKPNTSSSWSAPATSDNNVGNSTESTPDTSKPIFGDIDGHWAADYITKLYNMNVVNGREDGTFGVDEPITRAEFAKMIVSWLKLNSINDVTFGDVNKNDWYYEFVAAAAENDLINGDNGEFRPNDAITREDAAVIIYRAIAQMLSGDDNASFADADKISDYARAAVAKLSSMGIINGYDDNTFAPKNSITRAEAAKIIVTANEFVD